MVIKRFLHITLVWFFGMSLLSGQTESQRKFVFSNYDSIAQLIETNGELGAFGFHQHATYFYFDIYFDTPDKLLQKQQVSMRMRIQYRPGSKDSLNYTFQLKTEMTHPGAPRLEMEESDLDIYRLIFQGKEIRLHQLLEAFKEESQKSAVELNFSAHLTAFTAWFKQKSGAPIAPFQGLRFLFPKIFTEQVIAALEPVCFGEIRRTRAHVYLKNPDDRLEGVKNKERSLNDLPSFFIANRQLIWLMELSLDRAIFYSIQNPEKSCSISELELESKFDEKTLKQGNILAYFAETLLQNFKAEDEIRSKFKQVVDCLGG
jgi:hypothetical protein